MASHKREYSMSIKEEAHRLGFDACGISKVERLDDDAERLRLWLLRGMQGEMDYMVNNFEKRVDPAELVPGSKSVVSVLLNYFPSQKQQDPLAPIISGYAFGEDYHKVLKKKLKLLFNFINTNIIPINGRSFVDSAPVLDRAWAARSGLGWIGKNSNLISTRLGSFVFIGSLIIDLELSYDSSINDHCGGCTKCIQACPTHAIQEPRVIDSNKCISYLTIENKKKIPEFNKDKFENRVFGCDICQDVCPWNRKVKPHHVKEFEPLPDLLEMTKKDWENLDEDKYNKIFKKTALKRAKYSGLRRNIDFIRETKIS
jgi:epoxyqueuosine reductase